MNMVALETVKLGMRYGRAWALQNCSFSLEKGKIAGLVGPNGAGKTTLIHLAVGLLAPVTGQVRVFGLSPTTQAERMLPMVGFVGQDRPLYRSFSVREMLRFGRELNPRWDERFALQHLEQLQIPPNQVLGKLSGGQQAQVALTLALAKRPELLLLDEPVAALDPLARRAFFQTLMDAVVESETTVLFSSHQVADLDRICDHLILLSASQVQVAGAIEPLLAEHHWVTCPLEQQGEVERLGVVLQSSLSSRSCKVMLHTAGFDPQSGWDVQAVTLEDMILAYLARPNDLPAKLIEQHPPEVLQ